MMVMMVQKGERGAMGMVMVGNRIRQSWLPGPDGSTEDATFYLFTALCVCAVCLFPQNGCRFFLAKADPSLTPEADVSGS